MLSFFKQLAQKATASILAAVLAFTTSAFPAENSKPSNSEPDKQSSSQIEIVVTPDQDTMIENDIPSGEIPSPTAEPQSSEPLQENTSVCEESGHTSDGICSVCGSQYTAPVIVPSATPAPEPTLETTPAPTPVATPEPETTPDPVEDVHKDEINIQLEMLENEVWTDTCGKTLDFISEDGKDIIWEPGAEYKLPVLRINNSENSDIEYTVEFNGINSDAKLNEVMRWYYLSGENESETSSISGTVKSGETSDIFTLKGCMSETASNDYQGLVIDGISITVTINILEDDVLSGPYYTINTDKDLVIDEQGKTIVLNDREQNYLASVNGEKITLSNATITGDTYAFLFGQYRGPDSSAYNNEVNNVNVYDVNVFNGVANGKDKMSIAVYVYGNTVLNNCNMKGTTSDAEGYEVYDLGTVNKSNVTINSGEYGSVYVWSQAHVTINDAKIDKIVCSTITTRNLGMLTIGSGTHVGTIDLTVGGWTQYKPALTIEEGAVVDNIIYKGITYTQSEWINNNPV